MTPGSTFGGTGADRRPDAARRLERDVTSGAAAWEGVGAPRRLVAAGASGWGRGAGAERRLERDATSGVGPGAGGAARRLERDGTSGAAAGAGGTPASDVVDAGLPWRPEAERRPGRGPAARTRSAATLV